MKDYQQYGRSRNQLHAGKLAEFRAWLMKQHWVCEKPKSPYEVLRMRHPKFKDPLIVHKKVEAAQHLTTWGNSQLMLGIWFAQRDNPQFTLKENDGNQPKQEPPVAAGGWPDEGQSPVGATSGPHGGAPGPGQQTQQCQAPDVQQPAVQAFDQGRDPAVPTGAPWD